MTDITREQQVNWMSNYSGTTLDPAEADELLALKFMSALANIRGRSAYIVSAPNGWIYSNSIWEESEPHIESNLLDAIYKRHVTGYDLWGDSDEEDEDEYDDEEEEVEDFEGQEEDNPMLGHSAPVTVNPLAALKLTGSSSFTG